MRLNRLGNLLAVLACLPALPAAAQWKVQERIETYAVSGQTGMALYEAIGARGPKVGVGRAIAYTDFDLTWSRDYRPQPDGSCQLASARPNLTITYRLPKATGSMPAQLQARWATFIAGVEAHERVHGEIIRDMVRQIEEATVGVSAPADPQCRKVRGLVQEKLPAIVDARNQRNRDFDRKELSDGGNVHQLILALVDPR